LRSGLVLDKRKQQELAGDLKIFAELSLKLSQAELELKNHQAQQKAVQERLGGIKVKIENLRQLELRKKEKQDQFKKTSEEESIYRDSRKRSGRKGSRRSLSRRLFPKLKMRLIICWRE